MADRPYEVLFRAPATRPEHHGRVRAEPRGQGRFKAYSAGSLPKGQVHPTTLRLLRALNYKTDGLRSKSWTSSPGRGAGARFRVHGLRQRRQRGLPGLAGQPVIAHWGVEDPASFVGSEEKTYAFFKRDLRLPRQPDQDLRRPADREPRPASPQRRLDAIGTAAPEAGAA